jgi:hypothetical protein
VADAPHKPRLNDPDAARRSRLGGAGPETGSFVPDDEYESRERRASL